MERRAFFKLPAAAAVGGAFAGTLLSSDAPAAIKALEAMEPKVDSEVQRLIASENNLLAEIGLLKKQLTDSQFELLWARQRQNELGYYLETLRGHLRRTTNDFDGDVAEFIGPSPCGPQVCLVTLKSGRIFPLLESPFYGEFINWREIMSDAVWTSQPYGRRADGEAVKYRSKTVYLPRRAAMRANWKMYWGVVDIVDTDINGKIYRKIRRLPETKITALGNHDERFFPVLVI